MQPIQENLPPKPLRRYTPEEVEAARAKVAARNSICRPDCPLCHGMGYIREEVEIASPLFGKLTLCPNVAIAHLPNADKYGLVPGEVDQLDWSALLPVNDADHGAAAARRLLARGSGWLFLWGPPGQAKTLILKIAVALHLRQNRPAAYTRMVEILDHLRSAFDTHHPSEESEIRLDWWAGLPVLAIDEFDRVRGTEYANERKFLLMDRRYEQAIRGRSITLLAANTNPATYDSYMADRILDGRFEVVHLEGESARPGLNWSQTF